MNEEEDVTKVVDTQSLYNVLVLPCTTVTPVDSTCHAARCHRLLSHLSTRGHPRLDGRDPLGDEETPSCKTVPSAMPPCCPARPPPSELSPSAIPEAALPPFRSIVPSASPDDVERYGMLGPFGFSPSRTVPLARPSAAFFGGAWLFAAPPLKLCRPPARPDELLAPRRRDVPAARPPPDDAPITNGAGSCLAPDGSDLLAAGSGLLAGCSLGFRDAWLFEAPPLKLCKPPARPVERPDVPIGGSELPVKGADDGRPLAAVGFARALLPAFAQAAAP